MRSLKDLFFWFHVELDGRIQKAIIVFLPALLLIVIGNVVGIRLGYNLVNNPRVMNDDSKLSFTLLYHDIVVIDSENITGTEIWSDGNFGLMTEDKIYRSTKIPGSSAFAGREEVSDMYLITGTLPQGTYRYVPYNGTDTGHFTLLGEGNLKVTTLVSDPNLLMSREYVERLKMVAKLFGFGLGVMLSALWWSIRY